MPGVANVFESGTSRVVVRSEITIHELTRKHWNTILPSPVGREQCTLVTWRQECPASVTLLHGRRAPPGVERSGAKIRSCYLIQYSVLSTILPQCSVGVEYFAMFRVSPVIYIHAQNETRDCARGRMNRAGSVNRGAG